MHKLEAVNGSSETAGRDTNTRKREEERKENNERKRGDTPAER